MINLQQQARDLFDLDITSEQVAALDRYQQELASWNEHTNLTAITEPEEVRVRHFLDSLSLLQQDDEESTLIDIGSGAGFPGLPLAIVHDNLHVTVVDSVGKKVRFMQHIIDTLGLTNARAIHARAEDIGQDTAHRAQYNIVTARAVARLPVLLEYMMPLAKIDGVCVAMKGSTAREEADDAKRALYMLGGELGDIRQIDLPGVEHPHFLVPVFKTRKTPKIYPRKAGTPSRSPIGS